jgi:hypothetical protein
MATDGENVVIVVKVSFVVVKCKTKEMVAV